ncbi:putative membrane protein [Lysobacter dokdonensis DS-58]|uniref:Putative membrane protein n=1 Tax=Lysobacter dokdonensis DS-58 TaxID=1300345 RepID=A0A0A2WK49_9GAMM|nr:hypothetical protein [Lysobacter dokdonensis]KGQ19097.1 putative membrane protein [Lysobacter dokdonensis DS-58]
MGLISLVWGIVAMVFMCIALIPLLGIANWLVIPFAAVGAVIGAIGVMLSGSGKNGRAKAGLVLNGIVIVVAVARLHLGGGII